MDSFEDEHLYCQNLNMLKLEFKLMSDLNLNNNIALSKYQ